MAFISPFTLHYLTSLPVSILTGIFLWSGANAAEISNFKTTSVESYVELSYLSEDRTDSNMGVETLSQSQKTYEQKYSILTHNYVYHPSFLKLDLGAGYTLLQDTFEEDDESRSDNDGLYSLYGRASFLEKKPYPVSLYYIRDNPASFPGLAERVQQTNTTYGFDASILEPVIPLKFNMFASFNKREGDSLNQIVDDSSDRYGFRASKNYSGNYSQQFTYDRTEDQSRSGSRNLVITPTERNIDVATYSSDWVFGKTDEFKYFDYASYTKEDGTNIRDEVNFSPNLIWTYSDTIRSTYHYNYLDTSINNIDTTNNNATANVNYLYSEQIEYDAGTRFNDNQTTGVDNRTIGVNGRVSYKRPVPNGTLSLSAGFGYDKIDRNATSSVATVIGEIVTLSGLTPAALAQDFIVTSTIIVENLSQTTTFIEGIDYRVIAVGTRTEIQRLSGSSINDPEPVRVEYTYQTGGSASYDSIKQAYHAGLSIYRYYNFYVDYQKLDQDITAGNPTLPLNSQNTLSTGAMAEYPVNAWFELGGNVDLVTHDEEITPYDSQRYGTYGQFILPWSSNLRLTANKFIVDNENTDEDVDLTSFALILRSRPTQRMTLTAEAYTEEDTGASVFRSRDTFKLTAQWQLYRLRVQAEALYSNEQTGEAETQRTHILITIRRDI